MMDKILLIQLLGHLIEILQEIAGFRFVLAIIAGLAIQTVMKMPLGIFPLESKALQRYNKPKNR